MTPQKDTVRIASIEAEYDLLAKTLPPLAGTTAESVAEGEKAREVFLGRRPWRLHLILGDRSHSAEWWIANPNPYASMSQLASDDAVCAAFWSAYRACREVFGSDESASLIDGAATFCWLDLDNPKSANQHRQFGVMLRARPEFSLTQEEDLAVAAALAALDQHAQPAVVNELAKWAAGAREDDQADRERAERDMFISES